MALVKESVSRRLWDEGVSITYLILKLFDVFHCNFLIGMYLNFYSHFFSYKTKTQGRGRTSFCG